MNSLRFVCRQRLLGDDRLRRVVDDADLREAFRRIVPEVRIKRRRRRLRPHVADRDGVAVRRGLGGAGHAETAAGAADVLDDEGGAERAPHVLADQAGDDIGRPARGERHDDIDRFGRILLRGRRQTPRRQRNKTTRSQETNAPHRALLRRSARRSWTLKLRRASDGLMQPFSMLKIGAIEEHPFQKCAAT